LHTGDPGAERLSVREKPIEAPNSKKSGWLRNATLASLQGRKDRVESSRRWGKSAGTKAGKKNKNGPLPKRKGEQSAPTKMTISGAYGKTKKSETSWVAEGGGVNHQGNVVCNETDRGIEERVVGTELEGQEWDGREKTEKHRKLVTNSV